MFGSGSAVKSQPAKKPFGAPDEEEKSDDEEDGSSDDGEDKKDKEAKEEDGGAKSLGLKEQEGRFIPLSTEDLGWLALRLLI